MKYFLILLLITSPSLWATEEFKIYVNTFDPDFDAKSLESSKVEVTQGTGAYSSRVAKLPETKEMEKIFMEAGLKEEIQSMDQMQRDILYRKSAERDVASVKSSYPELPAEKLLHLKKSIEARQ